MVVYSVSLAFNTFNIKTRKILETKILRHAKLQSIFEHCQETVNSKNFKF